MFLTTDKFFKKISERAHYTSPYLRFVYLDYQEDGTGNNMQYWSNNMQ